MGPRPQYPWMVDGLLGDMLDAYTGLHELGYAHWSRAGKRVGWSGSLWCSTGGVFFAESMFTRVDDAVSKVAFVRFVRQPSS